MIRSLADVCVSGGANDRLDDGLLSCLLQVVVESVPMAVLMEGLCSDGPFRSASLRCVGNIATGTDTQTQALLDAGLLSHMGVLLRAGSSLVRSPSAPVTRSLCSTCQHADSDGHVSYHGNLCIVALSRSARQRAGR